MFKKKLNLIFIGITLIFFGFLISILSIDTVRSQIAQKVGITVAQSPIRWNDAKDVAAGATAQTFGIPMSGLYGYNGTNWNGLLTSTHGDNLITTTGLNTAGFLYAFDGVNWDRVRATGLTDANATAAGVGMAAFPLMWNGATWDLVRGDTTNGLWANIKASVNLPVYTTISATISTAQIAVDNTVGGTLIKAANASRRSIIIRNQGTVGMPDIYVGVNGVTTATGLLIKLGESITLDRNTAAIYGITAAASTIVGYLEE